MGIFIQGKAVIVTPTGLKLGSKGKVLPAGKVLGMLPKGEARKLRKGLYRLGHHDKAGARRMS